MVCAIRKSKINGISQCFSRNEFIYPQLLLPVLFLPFMRCLSFVILLLGLSACGENTPAANAALNTPWNPPALGTLVASDSMRTKDELNEFYFALRLSVSANNENEKRDYGFVYDITTHYGPGRLNAKLTMPPGGKSLKPLIRRSKDKDAQYIIGFIIGKELGGDGRTFQRYYQVTGSNQLVEIKQLESYRFQ